MHSFANSCTYLRISVVLCYVIFVKRPHTIGSNIPTHGVILNDILLIYKPSPVTPKKCQPHTCDNCGDRREHVTKYTERVHSIYTCLTLYSIYTCLTLYSLYTCLTLYSIYTCLTLCGFVDSSVAGNGRHCLLRQMSATRQADTTIIIRIS